MVAPFWKLSNPGTLENRRTISGEWISASFSFRHGSFRILVWFFKCVLCLCNKMESKQLVVQSKAGDYLASCKLSTCVEVVVMAPSKSFFIF